MKKEPKAIAYFLAASLQPLIGWFLHEYLLIPIDIAVATALIVGIGCFIGFFITIVDLK